MNQTLTKGLVVVIFHSFISKKLLLTKHFKKFSTFKQLRKIDKIKKKIKV